MSTTEKGGSGGSFAGLATDIKSGFSFCFTSGECASLMCWYWTNRTSTCTPISSLGYLLFSLHFVANQSCRRTQSKWLARLRLNRSFGWIADVNDQSRPPRRGPWLISADNLEVAS